MGNKEAALFSINWNACIQCGACVAVCPQPHGFTSPFDTIAIDKPCDIACMFCEAVCPVSAITHTVLTGVANDANAIMA
jgi:formate hydrogenlyase subunit 6/NADH:ubiquinone oxidoreductase subunit I